MTDLAVENQPSGSETGGASAPTAGSLLRQARERQNMDVAVLASVLKVSEHKIHALENNDLAALPDLAFARSLASSLARILNVEAGSVLSLLPKAAPTVSRVAHEALNAPYRLQSEGGAWGRAFSALQSRYLWVVLALLLAAVVLALLPQVKEESESAGAGNDAGSTASGVVTREVQSPVQAAPAVPDGPVAPAMPLNLDAPAPTPLATASMPATAPVQGASAALAAQLTASAPLVAASGDVQISTTQDSWVQVQDASGKTLLSRTVRAGESVALTGAPPYKFVVGSVAGVSLMVRGQAFDLASVAKGGTTARFSVP